MEEVPMSSRRKRFSTHRPWHFVWLLTVLPPALAQEPPSAEDAHLPGSEYAFYGRDHGGWRNLRRFFDHELYGRRGQRDLLRVLDGRAEDAVKSCKQLLATDPADLESLFCLCVARCVLGDPTGGLEAMNEATARGLPFERFLAGPRDLLEPLRETEAFRRYAAEQDIRLIHGPTLGCLTDTSARFWVRTVAETPVQVVASRSKDLSSPVRSDVVETRSSVDYTAVVAIEGLKPSTAYHYDVLVDGVSTLSPELPRFHTHARTGEGAQFRVGFGGGALYTPRNERMWDTIRSRDPAAFLFLGDNVYIDLPQAFGTLHSYTYHRRQSRPEFRRLASSVPLYAIWDDHDAAVDDCWLGPFRDKPSWKMSMLDGFRQNWNNPGYGTDEWPGCWSKFSIADVDFFLLDGRFYRTNPFDGSNGTMLGPAQKAWLLRELEQSAAKFKVLVSPVPWSFDTKGTSIDTWNGFQAERNEIFAFLEKKQIDGVVLVSADRHRSDARRIDRKKSYPLYEFESSRLTNKHVHKLVDGALFGYNEKQSFGLLTFDTAKPDPTVTFTIVNIDGESVKSLAITLSEISGKT
jgi:alkaline phosphatase D